MILSRAKLLNNDDYYASVRISKWLSPKELGDLKRIRQQCEELNQAHPVDKTERCKFFVRSGELIERPFNGRFCRYQPRTVDSKPLSNTEMKPAAPSPPFASTSSSTSTQAKNALRGSSGAPLKKPVANFMLRWMLPQRKCCQN
jgi:hypothetical protein